MPTILLAALLGFLPGEPKSPAVSVDEILAKWEKASAEAKTIKAFFTREDHSRLFDRKETFDGRFISKGADLLHMDFYASKPGKAPELDERLMLTGGILYQFQPAWRAVYLFPVSEREDGVQFAQMLGNGRAARYVHALSFGLLDVIRPDGPLLFLTIRADEARAHYQIDVMKEEADAYVLRFVPTTSPEKIELSQAVVKLSKSTFLPIAVRVDDPSRKHWKILRYTKIIVNEELPDDLFQPGSLEGWKVHRSGLDEPPAAAAPKP